MNNEQITDVNPNADEIKNLEAQLKGIKLTDLDPMDNGKVVNNNSRVVEQTQQPVVEVQEMTTSEDPIKTELERVKGQTGGKTPAEKMAYKLQRDIQIAKEMGIDINQTLGIKPQEDNDDYDEEKPLTRKDLEQAMKSFQPKSETAVDKAYKIQNEADRDLHLHYIENSVNPNLSEEDKFEIAQGMVNAIKFKSQINMQNLKPQTGGYSTAGSVQVNKSQTDNLRLTPEEEYIFRDAKNKGVPFSKEDIINMRKK